MHELSYGFGKLLREPNFERAVSNVVRALAAQGFGVLTRIDMQETLKRQRNVDFRRYVVLGACNQVLAKMALEVDPHIGLLLPCNVVVQQGNDGDLYLAAASPRVMFEFTSPPELKSIATETERRLRRAVDDVQ